MDRQYRFGLKLLKNRELKPGDAVMFDIDDTIITMMGQAIQPMIDLVKDAIYLGYVTVLMTARPMDEANIKATMEQLEYFDIPYSHLMFVPAEYKGDAKVKSGFNYILSVGDMETDLTESEHWINTSTGLFD